MIKEYILVSQKNNLETNYKSTSFDLVIHEYLSILKENLCSLYNFKVKTNVEELEKGSLNDLYVVYRNKNTDLEGKRYFYYEGKIRFNFKTKTLEDLNSNTSFVLSSVNLELLKNIVDIIHMITNSTQYVTKSNATHNITNTNKVHKENNLSSLLKNTQKIFADVKINNSKNIQNDRIIPTLSNSSDDEDDDDNNDYDEISEYSELYENTKKPFNTIISNNKNNTNNKNNIGNIKSNFKIPDDLDLDSDMEIESEDLENLKDQLEKLKELKNAEKSKLEELKNRHNKDTKNFSKYFNDLNDEKRFLRKEKERLEEKKRIFESDKGVYEKIKSEIEQGKVDENKIPFLFADKYPIFKFMDLNSTLYQEDDFITYTCLYDEIHKKDESEVVEDTYIPHNYHYLSKEEQEKYNNVKDNIQDDIEEFIKNKDTQQKYKSFEEVMKDLESDEEIDTDEINTDEINTDEFYGQDSQDSQDSEDSIDDTTLKNLPNNFDIEDSENDEIEKS